MEEQKMHYSAVLVALSKERWDEGIQQLNAIEGVEVHYQYPDDGKVIVVEETETRTEQEDALRSIQALSPVLYAELISYQIEDLADESADAVAAAASRDLEVEQTKE